MRDLLVPRYRYAVDDIPHRDLLDCLEAGNQLPFLELSTGCDSCHYGKQNTPRQTPVPPALGKERPNPYSGAAFPSRLLGEWHGAEEVALLHTSGPLGFFGARLTGGVSGRGVDVEHPEAVAQVKLQANPVGSPQIRQLRGIRPQLGNQLFYSTSGFARAAIVEAAEAGVALFVMGDDATIRPQGAHAQRLILDGHRRHGGDDALVLDYINSITERVRKAQANYGLADGRVATDAWFALHDAYAGDSTRLTRAESYLEAAVDAVRRHPRIGVETQNAVLSHFRNADLKAAFFCQVLGLPYPGAEPIKGKKGGKPQRTSTNLGLTPMRVHCCVA